MKKVKYRKSFATNIIAIFLIFNIFSIMFFSYYVKIKEDNKNVQYAKSSLQEIVDEKSELISISFNRIETHVNLLEIWMEQLLKNKAVSDTLPDDYEITREGMIIKKKNETLSNNEQSSLIVPNTEEKNRELYYAINITGELDKPFQEIIEKENVTWAYIVTKHSLLRCSPYYDVSTAFASDHNQRSDVFYTEANEKNNPERKAIWTKPYTDYLGKGWTMTCSKPIYDKNDEMYGVICLDLSIESIKEKYSEGFSLGKSGKIYWLDCDGNIFYHPDYDEESVRQGEVYEKNIFDDRNLSTERKMAIKEALKKDSDIVNLYDNGKNKIIVYSKIKGTNSTLFIEMNNDEFVASYDIKSSAITILVIIDIVLAIIFAFILFFNFSKPMKKLVNSANHISNGDYDYITKNMNASDTSIYEIKQLTNAFMTMNESIEVYMETLIEKNREISTILETVEGSLMIVNTDGKVKIKSKNTEGITADILKKAIEKILDTKCSFSEQVIINSQVFKNTYYPIGTDDIKNIVVSSDCITDSILMEKEIQQIEKMAGVGQLSAAIVHELKNTLALIKGATYILNMADSDEKNKKEINTINKAVSEAQNVIETLLDYSRKDSSGYEMIHIGTLINQILLLSKKEIIRKDIIINLDIDNNAYIFSNGREAAKVILQNIIINAIQAVNEEGIINICCYQDDNIVISIKDNGGGIKIEPIDRVFEPFLTTKGEGTGIGLWITKRLIESLNGSITVISEKGSGSTEFIICLPRK